MKKSMAAFAALALICGVAQALDDTPASRNEQVDRYLKAVPVREMFADMGDQMAKNLPENQRQVFKDTLTKHLDVPAVEKAIKEAMVRHFTAEEIKALTDFYSSPVGKSAMKKLGAYSADIMPTIQKEVMKAAAKAAEATKPAEDAKPAEEASETPEEQEPEK